MAKDLLVKIEISGYYDPKYFEETDFNYLLEDLLKDPETKITINDKPIPALQGKVDQSAKGR